MQHEFANTNQTYSELKEKEKKCSLLKSSYQLIAKQYSNDQIKKDLKQNNPTIVKYQNQTSMRLNNETATDLLSISQRAEIHQFKEKRIEELNGLLGKEYEEISKAKNEVDSIKAQLANITSNQNETNAIKQKLRRERLHLRLRRIIKSKPIYQRPK